MASQKIVLEFVGDATKLKPVTNALKGIKGLTKENTDEFKKTNEAAKKTGKTLDDTKKKQKGVTDETKKTTKGVDTLAKKSKEIPKQFDKAKHSMQGAKRGADGLLGSVKRIGGALLAAFGVTSGIFMFAKVITSLITVNRDFEAQMAKVKAITGATDKEFKKLSANAKKLGGSTKFTATEVGKLSEEFAKLGFSTDEIINASEATLLLAEATGSSLADAASTAGQVLRGFGLEASETTRVTDVMALSFSKSALNLENFTEAMKFVAPIAKAANIDIETTTALLGKLADAGLRGSIAGTGLKNLLSKLADANSDLSKELGFAVKNSDDLFRAFKKLKEGNIDLTKATELTDERSKAAFLTLINGAESAEALYEALTKATGSTKEMALIMRDTLTGDVNKLSASWEALMITLSKSDSIRKAVQFMDKWLQITNLMAKSNKQMHEDNIEQNREAGVREAEYFNKRVANHRKAFEEMSIVPELGIHVAISKTNEEIKIVEDNITEFSAKIKKLTGDGMYTPLPGTQLESQLQDAQIMVAKYEASLEVLRNELFKLKDEAKKAGDALGDGGKIVEAINSIENLTKQMKALKTTYTEAEIGSAKWVKAIGDMALKTHELSEANRIAKEELLKFKAANDLLEPTGHIEQFKRFEHEWKESEKRLKAEREKATKEKFNQLKIDANLQIINAEDRAITLEMIELEHLKEMRANKKRFGEDVSDIDLQIAQNQAKIWDEQEEKYRQFLAGMESDAAATSVVLTEQQIQQFNEVLSGADHLYSSMTKLHTMQLTHQQRNLDNQLEQGLISQETYDAKKRELARKQAIADKNAALFKAIINVAAAVATALGGGPIIGQVLAGITAALGAVEIGIIASTPIPAYAKGTKEAPKGFKWVGEKGAELIYDDGGYPIITHKESNVLSENPYSPEAQKIMRKYDIPQLHTGLFNNHSMNHELIDKSSGSRTRDIDYDKLARVLARQLDGGDVVGAINSHKKSDARALSILARELSRNMKAPKRGNYA